MWGGDKLACLLAFLSLLEKEAMVMPRLQILDTDIRYKIQTINGVSVFIHGGDFSCDAIHGQRTLELHLVE